MARKKLYYLPGLFSLAGLPIIFLFFIPPDKPQPVLLRHFLPNDVKSGLSYRFSKYHVWERAKKKKQATVDFWYADSSDLSVYRKEAKIDFIRKQIAGLSFAHDTNSVLKIELGDGSSYGDFVRILNQLMVYDVKRYALTDNTLYVFANEKPVNPYIPAREEQESEMFYCGTVYTLVNSPEDMISLVNLSSRRLLFLIGFILLIIIPGLIRVKKILL
jgi:hypothetical protein